MSASEPGAHRHEMDGFSGRYGKDLRASMPPIAFKINQSKRIETWYAVCTPNIVMGCGKRLVLAGVVATGIGWAAGIPTPNVQQIIQRSAQEISNDWSQAPQYSFVERDVESKHNSRPTIKTYQVLMIDGSPYNRLIALDDTPLAAGEQAEELRKLQSEIQRRQRESEGQRSKRIEKYLRERHQDHALLTAMIDAFDFKLVDQELFDGRNCWVLDANPKPGYEPVSRETKVLTGMRGRLWIDQASGQWVKVEAEVIRTVSLYGFFARVRPGTKFMLEQEPVGPNLWLPKHFTTHVSASALGFLNENSVDDETYSRYEPMSQAMAQLATH